MQIIEHNNPEIFTTVRHLPSRQNVFLSPMGIWRDKQTYNQRPVIDDPLELF